MPGSYDELSHQKCTPNGIVASNEKCTRNGGGETHEGWQEELREMNQGKNGRPFRYPHSLILFLGTLRVVFGLPYRQLEGLARGLGRLISIPAPD